MPFFLWVGLAVVWIIAFVPGVAAITRGWSPPWIRGRILSPRLWGFGSVMTGLGFTVEMLPAAMAGRRWTAGAETPVWIVALCLAVCGLGLMAWAQRSARAT